MLTRLHGLLAAADPNVPDDEAARVEEAYQVFCALPPPSMPSRAPAPTPPARRAPAQQRSNGCVWWAVGVALLVLVVVVIGLVIAASVGGKSGAGAAASSPKSSPASPSATPPRSLPTMDSGVSGEVGTCWAESTSSSGNYRQVNCSSPLAVVRVYSEKRSPRECGQSDYFDIGGGWYLCLMDL